MKDVEVMSNSSFKYSEQGTDSSWKGYTSQSLYILYRIVNADFGYDYYPEKLEDLMIKQGNEVIEVVQVKDYSSELTISDLDASKKSEGLFRRSISLKKNENSRQQEIIIRVVYFGELGHELSEFVKENLVVVESIIKKLCDKYNFTCEEAKWLLVYCIIEI